MTGVCAITLDLHATDATAEIIEAHAVLAELGFVATYFVPTSLLEDTRFREALRAIDDGRSEIGTHSHLHDRGEIAALSSEKDGSLEFLKRSVETYQDFFGRRPSAFRSPCWCWLSERAIDALAELGYHVDSSSTPQRLGLLSSSPFQSPWLTSPRAPTFLRPGLLEVPTSSFVVPFGRLSLAAFRKWGGIAFASAFCAEAMLTGHIVNLQLHPDDFVPEGERARKHLTLQDFIPRPGKGFGVRHWGLDLDRRRMTERVLAVLGLFRRMGLESVVLSAVYDALYGDTSREPKGPACVGKAVG